MSHVLGFTAIGLGAENCDASFSPGPGDNSLRKTDVEETPSDRADGTKDLLIDLLRRH